MQAKLIPHNKPDFGSKELLAVKEVIESGFLVQGKKVKKLELKLSDSITKKYCTAVSSGTTALSLALKSLKISENDEVIIPSYTCSALYHAIKFNNATPIYADIEDETYNLSPDSIKTNITKNTKAIIFQHMFGQPGYIEEVKKFGLPVIEDIAQSVGAKIDNKMVGGFGDITVMSFYATKMLGAGEGGAILTNDKNIFESICNLREYDESSNLELRYNAKMTDITAAIALVQLSKLESFIEQRKNISKIYKKNLHEYIALPFKNNKFTPNYYRQIIHQNNVNDFIKFGKQNNIQFRKAVHKPLHLYENRKKLPITEKMWKSHISLPIFTQLNTADINKIIKVIQKYEKNN